MRTKKKINIAARIVITVIGCIIFGGIMLMIAWDKLDWNKYERNEHVIADEYKDISINARSADITFVITEGAESRVECYERRKVKHSVSVEDGTLVIEVVDTRKWYDYISIGFGEPSITVYLPAAEYGALSVNSRTGDVLIPKELSFESAEIEQTTGDVSFNASATRDISIKTTTGDICFSASAAQDVSIEATTGDVTAVGVSARSLRIEVSTGKISASQIRCDGDVRADVSTGRCELADVKCRDLFSEGDTGSLILDGVIASGTLRVQRDTGNVRLDGCDAAQLYIETDTGDVTGSLLSGKTFVAKTDTGRVSVPSDTTGGRCEISTDTGDIRITVG